MTDENRIGQAERLVETLGGQWRESLESIVTTQLEQYGSLDAISNRQRACIESGDADRLLGLLGERSTLIESIAESAERFAPYVEHWSAIETALPEAAWQDLRRRLDAIASIADSIARRDAEDTRLIEQNKNSIADRLAGVTKSKKAAQAYAGPRKSGARYQDREA
jgi:hypothetical protein